MSAWTAARLAALLGARCAGPCDVPLTGLAALDRAAHGDLSFSKGGVWTSFLSTTRASAVILAEGEVPEGVGAIYHPEPRWAFARAASLMRPAVWPDAGVHPTAVVDPSATVEGAAIGPLAVIGPRARVGPGSWVMASAYVGAGAILGERCRIMPHAVIMDGSILGDRVWLQPGAVVGADGFGQEPGEGGPLRVPQLGIAVLEDDVEIGANACVDRAALHETRVGTATRTDNLVQIAHGVRIGARGLLAAFSGVGGSATLGDDVVLAGRASVVDGVRVGDRAVLAGMAAVTRNTAGAQTLGGAPARPIREWLRETALLRSLPRLAQRIRTLEDQLQSLQQRS